MISRGIVLKKTDNGENNQLVTFYTRDFGKLTGIAKSIKKPTSKQASHLEVFNLTDFLLVSGRGYPIITGAQSVEVFPRLKSSLAKVAAGFWLLESFDRLVYDHEKDPALWNFLVQALRELNDREEEKTEKERLKSLEKMRRGFLTAMGYARSWEDSQTRFFLETLNQKKFWSMDFLDSAL